MKNCPSNNIETILMDIEDHCFLTDDGILFTSEGAHLLMKKVCENAKKGFLYIGHEEDKDIKGIIQLKFREENAKKFN